MVAMSEPSFKHSALQEYMVDANIVYVQFQYIRPS